MADIRLATDASALILDLHEKTLRAAEGGPDMAEEWVKLRADYVSACSTTAAIVAAAFQDQAAAASAMMAALEDLLADCREYVRINNLSGSDGKPATNHAMRRAEAAIAAAKAAGIK